MNDLIPTQISNRLLTLVTQRDTNTAVVEIIIAAVVVKDIMVNFVVLVANVEKSLQNFAFVTTMKSGNINYEFFVQKLLKKNKIVFSDQCVVVVSTSALQNENRAGTKHA